MGELGAMSSGPPPILAVQHPKRAKVGLVIRKLHCAHQPILAIL
jgi:hypothetical protein